MQNRYLHWPDPTRRARFYSLKNPLTAALLSDPVTAPAGRGLRLPLAFPCVNYASPIKAADTPQRAAEVPVAASAVNQASQCW
jgi:hypothetical protein